MELDNLVYINPAMLYVRHSFKPVKRCRPGNIRKKEIYG
jgi:hypothetical protein